MIVTIVAKPHGHQNIHAQALSEGLRAVGVKVQHKPAVAPARTDVVACWGWRIGSMYRRIGAEVLVMERGYLGDRYAWTSIAWNGLNGRARFPEWPDDGGARFREHFGELLKPWRTGGDYVLLIAQVPGDAALQGKDLRPWYEDQARLARERFNLPIFFRAHPQAVRRGGRFNIRGTVTQNGTLQDAFSGAAVVITFNSNTAVESVLAGIPTIATDIGSMAWDMSAHGLDEPLVRPAREQWAARLAWRQWTLDEIRAGAALRHLMQRAEVA